MKSKFWMITTLLIIVSMALASCAPKTVIQTVEVQKVVEVTATPPPPGVVKITIFVGFGTGTSPEQQAVHKELQDLYNSTHTDIQIEFLTVPWNEHLTKWTTMAAAGNVPDIALPIGVGGIAQVYKGWLDLTPYIQADNYDMTRYSGATTEIHNYPGQGVLGLPLCVYPTVDFYNKDIFDAAGVEYPPHQWAAPYADGAKWDYTKLVEVAKKLTLDANGNDANSPAFDPKNIKQFGWDGWDWGNNIEWAMFFGDESGTGTTVDGKKSTLLTKQYVDAITFLKDAVWTTHIRANGEQSGAFYTNAGDPMGSGMVGMWEVNSWMSYAWPSWSEKFKWDIAAEPEGFNGKLISITDADTTTISAATKHPKEAWEVMKWLFEQPQYDKLIANYGCIPADTKSLAGWKGVQEGKFPGVDFQVILDGMNYLEKVNHEAWKPHYDEINAEMAKVQSTIMAGTNLDVQAVLKESDAAVQKLLDQYWAANP